MIPKHIGRDCELSTTGVDADGQSIDPWDVAREILGQLETVVAERGGTLWSRTGGFHSASMDCLRHWLSNGQCYYCDMSHVECCTATCLDPFDFAAQCWHLARVAEEARRRAESESADGSIYSLSTSNADLLDPSISFGTHLSVTVEPSLWEDLFRFSRRPARLAAVSSGIAAAIPFFGAGYLLPLKNRTVYSLSARAHHLSHVSTYSTTEAFARGLLNSRREPHGEDIDRLHLIGFDFCLPSSPLLCSLLQCLLAAAEEGFCGMQLYDPVAATRIWSYGLDLQTGRMDQTALLVDGRRLTLPQYLHELVDTLLKMCRAGFITEDVAPRAAELLPRIIDLTRWAEEGSVGHCAKHLTWAAKLLYLLNLCGQDGARWGDATTRLADHDFTNTDPRRGLIWSLWEQGNIDPLIDDSTVEACWQDAPAGTRDFTRGRLIRKFSEQIANVDWSYLEVYRSSYWNKVKIRFPGMDSLSGEHIVHMIDTAESVDEFVQRLNNASLIENDNGQLYLPFAFRNTSQN